MPTTSKLGSRQLVEEIILRGLVEMLDSSRRNCSGSDNILLREVKTLHGNITKTDLPDHLRAKLNETAQAMLGLLNKEGFVLQPKEDK